MNNYWLRVNNNLQEHTDNGVFSIETALQQYCRDEIEPNDIIEKQWELVYY